MSISPLAGNHAFWRALHDFVAKYSRCIYVFRLRAEFVSHLLNMLEWRTIDERCMMRMLAHVDTVAAAMMSAGVVQATEEQRVGFALSVDAATRTEVL
jgi:hypothetical protein